MSIQHVLESARKLGLPIILTDLGGRDPLVVLPLEQFEAMAGESPAKSRTVKQTGAVSRGSSDLERLSPAMSATATSLSADLDALVDVEVAAGDIPLDERFYLEPVDEDKGV
jgi:hypothetical protein